MYKTKKSRFFKTYIHEFHTVYDFGKGWVFIKNSGHEGNRKLRFWHGWKHPLINYVFRFSRGKNWRYTHWLVRTPMFFTSKDNSSIKIGLPNFHLWKIRQPKKTGGKK